MSGVALNSSERDAIERTVDVEGDSGIPQGDLDVETVFEVRRCAEWIRDRGLKRVALQFPDSLLRHAPEVAGAMERRLDDVQRRVAVLGDTSYGECCVDEVAAQHVEADGIVHFGAACLTRAERLPVLYVFTDLPVDLEDMREKVEKEDEDGRVFVFYDVRYHKAFQERGEDVLGGGGRFVLCSPADPEKTPEGEILCGRHVREKICPSDAVLYCGVSEKYRLVLSLQFGAGGARKLLAYDPGKKRLEDFGSSAAREIKRRRYLVERARDAARVGVLVGTLGAARYRDAVNRVSAAVRRRGKKAYIFLVGKPNVPKLANFPEVDVFVLVACPENSVITSREFLQPIITPLELEVALNPARQLASESSSAVSTSFRDVLPGGRDFVELPELSSEEADLEDGPGDVSLVTGRVRVAKMDGDRDASPVASSTSLSTQETSVSVLHRGGGGEFLSERSWKGLEQRLGETEVKKAVEGRRGIAMEYEGEAEEGGDKD